MQARPPCTCPSSGRLGSLAGGAACARGRDGANNPGSVPLGVSFQDPATVTAIDLDIGFLSELSLPNLEVLRHDVTSDEFPDRSFDLAHVRAVLMHRSCVAVIPSSKLSLL